jgi:predicted nucleic acid-binding protein
MGPRVEVLLDSVILIDHLNGVAPAEVYLQEVQSRAVVSVVTRAEVLAGYSDEELPVAVDLLNSFPALGIDVQVADATARLRRDHRWKLPDAFQAAIAQRYGLRFATRNTRDFPPDRFPFVVVPYEI